MEVLFLITTHVSWTFFFAFCRLLKLANKSTESFTAACETCYQQCLASDSQNSNSVKTYQEICLTVAIPPMLPLDKELPYETKLLGMRFYIVGSYNGIGKMLLEDVLREQTCTNQKNVQYILKQLEEKRKGRKDFGQADIEEFTKKQAGEILKKDRAERLLSKFSRTPNCYIILKSQDVVDEATKFDKNKKDMSATLKNIRIFAGGDWKFLCWKFIFHSFVCHNFVDPDKFLLVPGENVRKVRVNDIRPLMERQRGNESFANCVSVITAQKQYRKDLDMLKRNKRKICDSSDSADSTDAEN